MFSPARAPPVPGNCPRPAPLPSLAPLSVHRHLVEGGVSDSSNANRPQNPQQSPRPLSAGNELGGLSSELRNLSLRDGALNSIQVSLDRQTCLGLTRIAETSH
jgi:hypothetical protein